ncbi:KGG domain-containing protein [Brevundimonas sp. NIBR11]|uniref:general stress protein n=1 Tax=Brevundimonas sp. NIBR11 TaxID=3015999 RepID=UPI0022F13342|nr:KGG domain-containing protein [Brevundimonas sp. NIBR11]
MDNPDTGSNRIPQRGFGSMNPERQREIARKGGAAVPSEKRSFSQNSELAREAGRKGGSTTGQRRATQ